MKTTVTPLTAVYAQWLESFRSMLPGWSKKPDEPTAKQEKVAAHQEWEDEGGTVSPTDATLPGPVPVPADLPKLPL